MYVQWTKNQMGMTTLTLSLSIFWQIFYLRATFILINSNETIFQLVPLWLTYHVLHSHPYRHNYEVPRMAGLYIGQKLHWVVHGKGLYWFYCNLQRIQKITVIQTKAMPKLQNNPEMKNLCDLDLWSCLYGYLGQLHQYTNVRDVRFQVANA